ncbi:hypothetical protein J4558_27715 [Leptolyngbya sp. 15MV]|nr:hypothetical protein J4558_27715 [Leptolyngbya sp. 15MV]
MGLPRVYLTTSMIGAAVFPVLFLLGVRHGPMGLVEAWWIAAPTLLAATLLLTLPRIGLGHRALARELAPIALACGAMTLAVLGLRPVVAEWLPVLQLLALVPLGVGTYFAALWLIRPAYLRETWAMARQREIAPVPEPA